MHKHGVPVSNYWQLRLGVLTLPHHADAAAHTFAPAQCEGVRGALFKRHRVY